MKQYIQFSRKKEDRDAIFKHLDELRERRPTEYSKLVEEHSDDLFDIGYLKRNTGAEE